MDCTAVYPDTSTFPLTGENDIRQTVSHENMLNYKTTTSISTGSSVEQTNHHVSLLQFETTES